MSSCSRTFAVMVGLLLVFCAGSRGLCSPPTIPCDRFDSELRLAAFPAEQSVFVAQPILADLPDGEQIRSVGFWISPAWDWTDGAMYIQ